MILVELLAVEVLVLGILAGSPKGILHRNFTWAGIIEEYVNQD
jgi:hypothetical protein